ncbi:disulfide bond formation protein DsbA [Brachybacterium sp. JHP9]|uniref:Disulfide bond formation protein DsbA n=1 Tax=Brachybacterium equifaecis TaxID=2910770 RepID=A0ABT0QWC4_9MICO|nr:disulfide bond formation protein DsbA [Brachybacterium equifaecis]MCL6421962.1 disulfide bond formation protein DsbA [Brachybacterium equifaecis]
MSARPVELFFDPICPWAWMTSRWLLSAAEVREIAPTFSIMSLAALNEGRDLDEDYRKHMDEAWGPARLALAVEKAGGQEDLAAFYTAWGETFHVGGNKENPGAAEAGLEKAGLDASLISALEDESLDDELRARQKAVVELVGDEVGTPVISFGEGVAYFGPVISPAPKGEEAGVLFDGLEAMSRVSSFFELKRSRTTGPVFD